MTRRLALDSAAEAGSAADEQRPLSEMVSRMGFQGREGVEPPSESDLGAGFILDGRFEIREVIGRSGMATVYLANDADTGAAVAVKVPRPTIESDPVSFGRFEREAKIGAALSAPSLLRFVPTAGPRSRPYIVTEYLDGRTLAWAMHQALPFAEADALRIAAAVGRALRHMHAKGVIHRDVKPGNVMICRDGRLCLMDFGLAEEVGETRGFLSRLTPLFGTPEYMAPEQVANRSNDERTDIYSLGVILYQMLTGRLPFEAEDPWAAAHMRVSGDPQPLRKLNASVSPEAEEIVLHAMRRRPSERHQTLSELIAELESPSRVHVTGLSGRLRAPRWRPSLQGTPIFSGIVIGVASLASMIGLFFVLSRHR